MPPHFYATPILPEKTPRSVPQDNRAHLLTWQFDDKYDLVSRQNAQDRAARRARARVASALDVDAHGSCPPKWIRPAGGDRLARKNELIAQRLKTGFQWRGGPVAGNVAYSRPAFSQGGLVSDQHAMLRMFVSKVPKAKRLFIGDAKHQRFTSDSKLLALDAAYVEDNKRMCGVLRIELDRIISLPAIIDACKKAGVPLPNIVVGWVDGNGNYWNPHLIWLLHDSVPLGDGRWNRFLSLYRGALRGLTKALLSVGADPLGLWNSHRHKNPISPLWDRDILAQHAYSLGAISEQVDITIRMSVLEKMAPAVAVGQTRLLRPDHPDPNVAAMSNRLFCELAPWARRMVIGHRAEGGDAESFVTMIAAEAGCIETHLAGGVIMSGHAARGTAASVAKWTWLKYLPSRERVSLSAEEITSRMSEGARKTATIRHTKTQAILVSAATELFAKTGKVPTQMAVLKVVRASNIRSEKTVRSYWPAVLAAVATGNLPSPYVKKLDVTAGELDGAARGSRKKPLAAAAPSEKLVAKPSRDRQDEHQAKDLGARNGVARNENDDPDRGEENQAGKASGGRQASMQFAVGVIAHPAGDQKRRDRTSTISPVSSSSKALSIQLDLPWIGGCVGNPVGTSRSSSHGTDSASVTASTINS